MCTPIRLISANRISRRSDQAVSRPWKNKDNYGKMCVHLYYILIQTNLYNLSPDDYLITSCPSPSGESSHPGFESR